VLVANKVTHFYHYYQYDWTPLHEAASNGQVEVVRLLVAYGADVKMKGGVERI
jgi:hypothetical protein